MNEVCEIRTNNPSMFPYFRQLQAVDPLFVTITKPISFKIGQTFCEGLKWMYKLFEIDWQKDL